MRVLKVHNFYQQPGDEDTVYAAETAALSRAVRRWLRRHNRWVKRTGRGVRLVACPLPKKSTLPNPIEPKWVHGKRRVVDPAGCLTARALAERVCAAFGRAHEPHLAIPDKVA